MVRRSSWLFGVAALAAVALSATLCDAPALAGSLDLSKISANEIKALELRLTDAGCYKGAIDGQTSAALNDAIKACPDQRPFLRIETGMHAAPITAISVDGACRLLATAADDRTIRFWSLPEGKLQQVLHLPTPGDNEASGPGHWDSQSTAFGPHKIALSPDGRSIAVAGWDTRGTPRSLPRDVVIVNLDNGAIRRVSPFGDDNVRDLALSPDGLRIAISVSRDSYDDPNHVVVFDGETRTDLFSDREHAAYGGVAFGPDGALLVSDWNGELWRYTRDLKLAVNRAEPDGTKNNDETKYNESIAIDATGQRAALANGVSGVRNRTWISIVDAKTLELLATIDTNDFGSFPAWSRDGSMLVASANAGDLRRFDAYGRRRGKDVHVGDAIAGIQPCGGGFVFATEKSFGLFSIEGVARTLQTSRTADMAAKLGVALTVSPDANSVRFGLEHGAREAVVFDLGAASLSVSPNIPPGFSAARVKGLPITEWRGASIKLNGKFLQLGQWVYSNALAIRSDASGFVIGAGASEEGRGVYAFDATGEELWSTHEDSEALGVNFSADGEVAVAALADGSLRWLRWGDGKELLALFVEPRTRKWVAWTPTGYYMASAGGEDLIGWQVNRGWEQAADFFPASQFRAQYLRPDIVKLVLKTKNEAEAVRQANAVAQREAAKSVPVALPPVVAITSPAEGSHFSADSVEISYSLRTSSGEPIDRLDVFADGEPIKATGFAATKGGDATGKVLVTLPKKDARLSIIAHSGELTSAPASAKLIYERPLVAAPPASAAAAPPDRRPKLYALLVGVTNYDDNKLNDIHFGARDAEGLADALERQKGGLYADVQTKIIDFPTRPDLAGKVIGPPTRDSVFRGLYWLKHEATDNDLVVVFLSGHGYRDFSDPRQGFWFLTREAKTDELPTTAISGEDLYRQISALPGKKIMFVDACHVGTELTASTMALPTETFPNMDKVVNDFTTAGSGIVVYAASQAIELAHEDQAGQHGAFAEALIEALGQGKGSSPDGNITTDLLDYYILERVKALTGGKQHPVFHRPGLVSDFPIAVMRH